MKYLLKSGILYEEKQGTCGPALANIKNRLRGHEKLIIVKEDSYLADILTKIKASEHRKGACPKKYILKDMKGDILMSGIPKYADGEDPAVAGWPVYRMPRVDSVDLSLNDQCGHLQMINSQNYRLQDASGKNVLTILHRGLIGGWDIEASKTLVPEIICGIFVFCRYIEQENELMVV